MMPAPSTGRSLPPQGQSLLSRLKSPFATNPLRNTSEFYIQPDDPHRQYAPGDTISGSVILKIVKQLRITHVVVCLHGYAQAYKTPNKPGEGYRNYSAALAAGKIRQGGGYYGNGFISLFEDEVVLCRDGLLVVGVYKFKFELEFPRDRLPSSIEFERGTISYVISATLTRPTTISPTMTCDRKVTYQEDIDVATLYQPKPRIISLEPISRRGKSKHKNRSKNAPINESASRKEVVSLDTVLDENMTNAEPPQSPSPSDDSFDSGHSSCGTGSAIDSNPSATLSGESKTSKPKSSAASKPVTATIELQQAGFLRGDLIPIKIHVHHTKQIRSLHGIIVTLYRQAHVNLNPALPKAGTGRDDHDTLLRSRSGMGTLSLSDGGSRHVFRKDLSQSFASLFINPNTLSAEVKATVRVPVEAFPTISTVPGSMISFKYFVEVVLDLQGRLAGLDRFLPNAGMAGISSHIGDSSVSSPADTNNSIFAAWGGHFMDTEEIRRDKSVVSCIFEIVIGTRDSERKGKWKQLQALNDIPGNLQAEWQGQWLEENNSATGQGEPSTPRHGHEAPVFPRPNESHGSALSGRNFPIPDTLAEEAQIPEKERLRRREKLLLPSRPPDDGVESSTHAIAHAPSAPVLSDELLPIFTNTAPMFMHVARPSAPLIDEASSSTAPAYEPRHPVHPHDTAPVTDVKHDLHQRELEQERSAPEDVRGDDEEEHTSAPTAPTFEDVEHFGFGFSAEHSLPRYER